MRKQLKALAFSITSKHWHQMRTTGYRSRCVQLSHLTWHIPEVRIDCHQLPTEGEPRCQHHAQIASRLRTRVFIDARCVKVKFPPSRSWKSVGASELGMSAHNPHSHTTAKIRAIGADVDPPRSATLPGVFLCPVISASPPPGCSQVVLLASSLLGEERKTIHFCAALFTPANTNRAEMTGAAVIT